MLIDNDPAVHRLIKAGQKVVSLHPEMLIPWGRVRSIRLLTGDAAKYAMGPICIDRKYNIKVNKQFVTTADEKLLMFSVAHELLHPSLSYFERAISLGLIDEKMHVKNKAGCDLFNVASDMVINSALKAITFEVPDWACVPPPEYKGSMDSESIWRWLGGDKVQQQQIKVMMQGGEGEEGDGKGKSGPAGGIGQGCGMMADDPADDDANAEAEKEGASGAGKDPQSDAIAARQEIIEVSRGVHKSGILGDLLKPAKKQPENWEKILKGAFRNVQEDRGYDISTYAKPKFRGAAIFPRYKKNNPTLAVIIDISGSMARPWVEQVIRKTYELTRAFPDTNVCLVTHTARVEWSGWVNGKTSASKIAESCRNSGDTRAQPAYDKVKEMCGSVDAVVHFTDTYIENPWPKVPGRRLIVGDYSDGYHGSPPPQGAKVLNCRKDKE
jgi:predicted metal-dependent peptidase